MRRIVLALAAASSAAFGGLTIGDGGLRSVQASASRPATAIKEWSDEARRAIVPPGPNGVFGAENYGNKFPGEAAVYMGIVHAAIFDTAVAIDGGYAPYAIAVSAPKNTSADAAVATATYQTLIGLEPALGLTPDQRGKLDQRYHTYLSHISDTEGRDNGRAIGAQISAAVLKLRQNDGRERNPRLADLHPPAPGHGVWDEGASPAIGLRLPGIHPLALARGSQFRPTGPSSLRSAEYSTDFAEVAEFGGLDSSKRSIEQTSQALFWTDHDVRQWNDGLLKLAADRDLDFVHTARLLAMAHAAGGDAMIACFDAKYAYWFWRPYQAVPGGEDDGNPATTGQSLWRPLRPTPNFPEYPSAHACHTTAIAESLEAFFGSDAIVFTLDSRANATTRRYERFSDVVADVNLARILVGFHFRGSDEDGSTLGRAVARYVVTHRFLPIK
jgi:hypothetical protein